jgi:hypothetical protein
MMSAAVNWFGKDHTTGLCEFGNETSGSVKVGNSVTICLSTRSQKNPHHLYIYIYMYIHCLQVMEPSEDQIFACRTILC